MRTLLCILLLAGSVFAQGRIHSHKHWDTTVTEDSQKFKRRRLMTNVDSTGFAMWAWGDECYFKIQLRDPGDQMNHYETGMLNGSPYVEYGNNNYWMKMYVSGSGGFEFDAMLRKKPGGGLYSMTFPIQTKGLRFSYQDTLSDIDKLDSYRPDSVIGSYAVYHSTRQGNVHRLNGVFEEYMAGKAFHIFRPKVWDDAGDTTWGFVNISWDSTALDGTMYGWMTVGVDPIWLANADFPVTLDPEFGLTTKGATLSTNSGTDPWALGPWLAPDDGFATDVTWYAEDIDGEAFVLGLYDDDTDYPDDVLMDTDGGDGGDDGWQEQPLDALLEITKDTPYWFGAHHEAPSTHYYDADVGYSRYRDASETYTGSLPDPFPAAATESATRQYSIFVTYEIFGGAGTKDTFFLRNQVAVEDSWIQSASATTNYGTSANIDVGDGAASDRRIVVSAPNIQDYVNAYSAEWALSEVRLDMYVWDRSSQLDLNAYYIVKPWLEEEVTWNRFQAHILHFWEWGVAGADDTGSVWNESDGSGDDRGGDSQGSVTITSTGWAYIDLDTAWINATIDLDSTVSYVIIDDDNNDGYGKIRSSEYITYLDSTMRFRVIMEDTTTVGGGQVMMIMGGQ